MTAPTFTYTPGAVTSLNWVREFIGDKDSTRPLLYDETINAVLALQSDVVFASVACCGLILGILARRVSESSGKTQKSWQQQFEQYQKLMEWLRAGGPGALPGGDGSGVPSLTAYAGGVSYSENEAMRQTTDLIQPPFSVGQDDNPGAYTGAWVQYPYRESW